MRDDILQQAEAAFAEHGYAGTSMVRIAAELGLTKAAIYHYFGSKRELLTALLDESIVAADAALGRDAPLEERLHAYADAYRDHLEPLTVVATASSTRRGGDHDATRVAVTYMQRSIRLLDEALSQEVDPERARLLAPIFSTLVHGAHMMALHHPGVTHDELVTEGVRVFVRGLREPVA